MLTEFPIKFKQDIQINIDNNEPNIPITDLLFNAIEKSKFLFEKWSFKIDKNEKFVLTIRENFLTYDLNDNHKIKYIELLIQKIVDETYNSKMWYSDYKFYRNDIYSDGIFTPFFIEKRKIIKKLVPIDKDFITFCDQLLQQYKYDTYGCKLPFDKLCREVSNKYKVDICILTNYLKRELLYKNHDN